MDTIEECGDGGRHLLLGLGTRILVGVPDNSRGCSELLSWAIGAVAKPSDSVVAVHVLGGRGRKRRLQKANAFVIYMLGEFVKACEAKQINLEAKVICSSNIGRALTQEAALTDGNILIVGRSRNAYHRSHFEIANYCFMHAPKNCSVIAVGRQGVAQSSTRLRPRSFDADSTISSSSTWSRRFPPLQKLLRTNSTRKLAQSDDKSSPRAVLDGPEGEGGENQECYSTSSHEVSRRGHNGLWRRLSDMKLWLPFLRNIGDDSTRGSDVGSAFAEDHKPAWRCFSFQEISVATNDFHPDNMAGRGGYAEVYKGTLADGHLVAVKRLAKGTPSEQKEKEFLAELGIQGHVCHPNTSYLLGCCVENGLYLIFEFCTNGTLASALHGKGGRTLEWPLRYKIAVGVARGLQYLHMFCRHRIIHRDIKASNVLLGHDFEPQISDFGLAKWLPKQWTHHSVVPIEGTFGYLAPEYFMHGIVDEKTDIFAFGVLLLEIVTGRRPIDCSKQSLLQWAKPLLEAGQVTELADPSLGDDYDKDQLNRMVAVASRCIMRPAMWRPSMAEVLHFLSTTDECLNEPEKWNIPDDEVDDMDDCTLFSESFSM
ncbi:ATP binding protein isoform 2 [Zea mays]|uniref:Putative receptor-like serine/threonine-protein kinase n=1 Tax=Zea mays TaxID=4577 RepID=A0A1D6IXZ8_MAIZE|nr:ATP binding protein isoform 2 [Zea mays]AQK40782.1 putative receptor-like serine/threonine-protein kinase [Zea mays]|eukprot:XP_008661875.1 ATP binding protein isoform X2 [Zea mays]